MTIAINGLQSNSKPDDILVIGNPNRLVVPEINGLVPYDININGFDRPPVESGCELYVPLHHPICSPTVFPSFDKNAYTLTKTGAPTLWTPSGLQFDGDDYIRNPTANWRSADSAGTLKVWFKTSVAASQMFFASCDEATTDFQFAFSVDANGLLSVITLRGAGTARGVRGDTVNNDGEWHLATLISNGTVWSMYSDLTLQTLTIVFVGNDGSWLADVPNRDNFSIGARVRSNIITYLIGTIGEVDYTTNVDTVEDITRYYQRTAWRYQN